MSSFDFVFRSVGAFVVFFMVGVSMRAAIMENDYRKAFYFLALAAILMFERGL